MDGARERERLDSPSVVVERVEQWPIPFFWIEGL
jgi:hypothetical protein